MSAKATDFIFPEIDFSNEVSIDSNDILQVTNNGISYKEDGYINFRQCAYYHKLLNGSDGICVANGDLSSSPPTLTFYTLLNPTSFYFVKAGIIKELLLNRSPLARFRDLQKLIKAAGYTTLISEASSDNPK